MDETSFVTKDAHNSKDVISFYNQYAETWDTRFEDTPSTFIFHQQRFASFKRVLKEIKCPLSALELGVGTGIYIDILSQIFDDIDAVDGSENMIQMLKRKIDNKRITNVKAHRSTVEDMPFIESESKDVVYFFGLIEHIINMEIFFSEVSRVLKPGGYVIGVTPNSSCPWYKIRQLIRGTGKHCSTDHYYNQREIAGILKNNSFSLEKIDFFGTVPAGLSGKVLLGILKLAENLRHTLLKDKLGGLTFLGKKMI